MTDPKKDVFQIISEDSWMLGVGDRFHERFNYYKERFGRSEDPAERYDYKLAILRIRRMRFDISCDDALTQLDLLGKELEPGSLSEIKHRILHAEVLAIRKADYSTAMSILEPIASKLANSSEQFLYGVVANILGSAYMMRGSMVKAEECYLDAISIFRRMNASVLHSMALSNLGTLRKKMCIYVEAEHLAQLAVDALPKHRVVQALSLIQNGLGVVRLKTGDWKSAEYYIEKAITARMCGDSHSEISGVEEVNLIHLAVMRRDFDRVRAMLDSFFSNGPTLGTKRNIALAHEFCGEAHMEQGDYVGARESLATALAHAFDVGPESDVMTEVLRRQAQLALNEQNTKEATRHCIACIRLSRQITDKHELSVALRILGDIHAREGKPRKAVSSYETAINTLRTIGECYELMRTSIAYAEFLLDAGKPDAEMYILEAKQLCSRLEIDFFMSKILFLTARLYFNNKDYNGSRACLKEAETIAENLQSCDRKQLMPAIKSFYKTLEKAILQASMKSAEKLKTLGKIYEESRFPLEELRPEMAADVAQNVGAQCLFLVRKRSKGFQVPIKYDISSEEAKRIVRMQLRNGAADLFELADPRVISQTDGRTLVAVAGQSGKSYVLCTVFPDNRLPGAGEVEFLIASVAAMERVAEEYASPTTASPLDPEGFLETKGLKHPGGHFKDILTLDRRLIEIIHLAERAAKTPVPILLQGETGCGKELFAQAIHSGSPRSDQAFIAMNAGGVPVNLFESQLFGHVKGAFTDAVTDRTGLIEDARGGTLFLDEVGEMGEELQVKLLRLLENGEYRRLGENEVRHADVRVISATNKNLEKRVQEGLFREDLYYRLATVSFEIPPLRTRKRDVELLVRHFLKDGLARIGRPHDVVHFDVKALEAFEYYGWPGNVRELRNEIMRNLSLLGGGEVVRFGMLSEKIKRTFESRDDGGVLGSRVERFERRLILKALEDNEWNRLKTAEEIGIPRTTLLFKMRKLNIVQQ